tara:strand:- start:185 stop:361 length:177 start_codon:yes stop_codon:yes gene_type:complete
MSIETLKNNFNKSVGINKVNVDNLKNKILEKEKKEKFQSRVILGSVLVSIGLLGYFVT